MKETSVQLLDFSTVKTHLDSTLTQFSSAVRYTAKVNLSYLSGFISLQLAQMIQRNEQNARGNFIFQVSEILSNQRRLSG
jgi:hypothetical protein